MFLKNNKIFDIGGHSNRILFIDSSTLGKGDWENQMFKKGIRLVVFDTTTYSLSSPRISEVLNLALDHDIPCALLRSHLKLDSLGMEYAGLGSLCLVYRNSSNLVDFILEKLPNTLCLMGGYATPEHIYPFYLDAEYQRKNNDRLSRVNESNRQFYQYLSQKYLFQGSELPRLRNFDHEMFCWISIQPNMDWDSFVGRLIEWTRGISNSERPCQLTESFGWDFIALSPIRSDDDRSNAQKAGKIWTIRVAIPDIGTSDFTAFADDLVVLLAEF